MTRGEREKERESVSLWVGEGELRVVMEGVLKSYSKDWALILS